MTEVKFDPGAAKFGNFINYYQFNPPGNRISLMPDNFLSLTGLDEVDTVVCLDIGCNSGIDQHLDVGSVINVATILDTLCEREENGVIQDLYFNSNIVLPGFSFLDLTNALYDYLTKTSLGHLTEDSNKQQNFKIIAIDIDSILIERANESNRNENITFLCLDIMKKDSLEVLNSYLKLYNKKSFDVSFSFSLTMWIHLNYGDEGLKNFLQTLCNLSVVVVLEPQPWKCYLNAKRRIKRTNGEKFNCFETLKIRNLVELEICNFLMRCNCEKVFETRETKWGRIIAIYKTKFK